jgi:Ca2+-binding EF-hand superfamily protein
MLKKSISLLTLSLFATSIITACGSPSIAPMPIMTEQDPDLQIYSTKTVYKEIKDSSANAFKEIDKNKDKVITPDEYGVATPDSAKAFYALDGNRDGKITQNEFMPSFFRKVGLTFRLQMAARSLFKQLDKNHDGFVVKDELNSGLVSTEFLNDFDKFDKEQKTFFHNDAKGKLSKSEFENMFAFIAVNNIKNTQPPAPAPAPSSAAPEQPPAPAPSAPAPAPDKK